MKTNSDCLEDTFPASLKPASSATVLYREVYYFITKPTHLRLFARVYFSLQLVLIIAVSSIVKSLCSIFRSGHSCKSMKIYFFNQRNKNLNEQSYTLDLDLDGTRMNTPLPLLEACVLLTTKMNHS